MRRNLSGKCKAMTTYESTVPGTNIKKIEWTKGEIFNYKIEGRFYCISNENSFNKFPRAVFDLNFKEI